MLSKPSEMSLRCSTRFNFRSNAFRLNMNDLRKLSCHMTRISFADETAFLFNLNGINARKNQVKEFKFKGVGSRPCIRCIAAGLATDSDISISRCEAGRASDLQVFRVASLTPQGQSDRARARPSPVRALKHRRATRAAKPALPGACVTVRRASGGAS